ncbi:MAG TPA: hypothetical protein VGG28_03935 [Kofleriaceae bacterium]|jgi:hypothetical protein
MQLDDLARVFGGQIRAYHDRRWLDAQIGGLRAFVVCRATSAGTVFDLAVFTPRTRELDPFFARDPGDEWVLAERAIPTMPAGFVFAGCRRGILFATSVDEPPLDALVGTLWQLARWAREPWRPEDYAGCDAEDAHERARARRERWLRIAWVMIAVVLLVWVRALASSVEVQYAHAA